VELIVERAAALDVGKDERGGGLPSASLILPASVGVGDDATLEVRT
jgi:hypothetical protein